MRRRILVDLFLGFVALPLLQRVVDWDALSSPPWGLDDGGWSMGVDGTNGALNNRKLPLTYQEQLNSVPRLLPFFLSTFRCNCRGHSTLTDEE